MISLSQRLSEIRQRLDAATPGPWFAWDRGVGWHIALDPDGLKLLPEGMRTDLGRREDAELIANTPSDLRFLLERVEAMEQEKAALRTQLDNYLNITLGTS